MKFNRENKTQILLGVFVAVLIAANLLGNKIVELFTFKDIVVVVSVGIFSYPITFLITDIVEEVYGKERTKIFIYTGIIALLCVLILTFISIKLPPASRFKYNDAYIRIFSNSARIIIASLTAFFISQLHDIWAFNFWKQKTKGKYLWLRNNASTMVSQFIDTTLFMFIAFYKVTPNYDVKFIFSLITPYYLLKILVAAIDTPFCYLGVKWLKS